MPNHCQNYLTIISKDTGFLQRLMNELKQDDNPKFLEILCPFTEDTNYEWDYNWCVSKWGTKWDIYDVASAELDGDTLHMTFSTAWSPPDEALRAGMDKYDYEFELYFQEDGMCFAGFASGDVYESWETLTDQHPEDYMPEHVLDNLPWIVQDWEEWQAEKLAEGYSDMLNHHAEMQEEEDKEDA